jgi:Ca2+-binding RTX toxin-like protein
MTMRSLELGGRKRKMPRETWVGTLEVLETRLALHAGHAAIGQATVGEMDPTEQEFVLEHGYYDHEAFDAWVSLQPNGSAGQSSNGATEVGPLLGGGPVVRNERGEMSVPVSPIGEVEPTNPFLVGQWSGVTAWPVVAVHAHMLPTGKVLFWPYADAPRLWDPASGTITLAATAGHNVFCSGHSLMEDGSLFVSGGHIQSLWGLDDASIYNPFTDSWTQLPDMNAGRWYPTNTTLNNGDVLVLSGNIDTNTGVNRLPQIWEEDAGQWRDLTSAELSLPLYPWMHVSPNGKVFNSGPSQTTRNLETAGTGAWTIVGNRTFGFRSYGSSVMYDAGKVLVVGGADPPTAAAEVIDLNAATPAWRSVAPMDTPRRQLNATVLPDGQVLVTGGSSAPGFNNEEGAVLHAEMWNVESETWSPMASMTEYRGYHSTALLLPDGRVLTAGGDFHPTAEVFSPPYLFKGPRPTISSAPRHATYGQTFVVRMPQTPQITQIAKVSLVRLSSVTHAFNMDQRIYFPNYSQEGRKLLVSLPTNPNILPPGYYMLFIINNKGVPSVAKLLRVDETAPDNHMHPVTAYGDGHAMPLLGQGGNDPMAVTTAVAFPATIAGGLSRDSLTGGSGLDGLLGQADNDTPNGRLGNNLIDGGAVRHTWTFASEVAFFDFDGEFAARQLVGNGPRKQDPAPVETDRAWTVEHLSMQGGAGVNAIDLAFLDPTTSLPQLWSPPPWAGATALT